MHASLLPELTYKVLPKNMSASSQLINIHPSALYLTSILLKATRKNIITINDKSLATACHFICYKDTHVDQNNKTIGEHAHAHSRLPPSRLL